MSQLFDKIRVGTPSRSTFDLSHHQVMTSDFGYLTPICVRDMVPGDDFVVTPKVFARLAPLAVPAYGKIVTRLHHFFVPYRILYPYWSMFVTGNKNNASTPPFFTVSALKALLNDDKQFKSSGTKRRGTYGRLMANLGLNPSTILSTRFPETKKINAFRFLAYYRIWMDYFMDSNIYDHSLYELAFRNMLLDGGNIDDFASIFLETHNACYKKDYLTTAKVNPQAGDKPSRVPVDVSSDLNEGIIPSSGDAPLMVDDNKNVFSDDGQANSNSIIGQFTVEAMRAATALQNWLERSNFVGSKVINQILAHFGVSPSAERLDYAEFIGGSSFPISIGDVTSTSAYSTGEDTYGLGSQAGKGVGAGSGDSVRYHAKEHGVFMTVMSILPDTAYYQGISKHWFKGVDGDHLDYFSPEFENLGYQEILNSEVYVPTGPQAELYADYDPDGVFGYTPRYSEYKFQNDVLSGDFVGLQATEQTTAMGNMDAWHLFRRLSYWSAQPLALNANFVECDNAQNSFDRIFQITSNDLDHFYFNIDMDVKATRPMSGFTAPTLDNNQREDGNEIQLPYGGTRL